MKKLITLLTLALSFSFADAKSWRGLKVKDHKNLNVILYELNRGNIGLTEEDIAKEVKLLFLQNGIKIYTAPLGKSPFNCYRSHKA